MKELKTYDERVTGVKDRHERELKRVGELGSLYTVAVEVAQEFDEGEATVKVDVDTWLGCSQVEIDIHAVASQHISMVKPLLKLIAATRKFGPARFYESGTTAVVHWTFYAKEDSGVIGSLQVTVWYGQSTVCRLVETGETKPVFKLVCDGNNIPMSEGETDDG